MTNNHGVKIIVNLRCYQTGIAALPLFEAGTRYQNPKYRFTSALPLFDTGTRYSELNNV
jgi:hypothetical protein